MYAHMYVYVYILHYILLWRACVRACVTPPPCVTPPSPSGGPGSQKSRPVDQKLENPGEPSAPKYLHGGPRTAAKRRQLVFLGPGRQCQVACGPGMVANPTVFLPGANFRCASRRQRSPLVVD